MSFFRIMTVMYVLALGSFVAPAHADLTDPANTSDSRCQQYFMALDLPETLNGEQRQRALAILKDANPHLVALHTELTQTLNSLRNLSFASDTPPDALEALGRKLVSLRNDILIELQNVSQQLERQAGFNPGWGQRRTCALQQMAPQPETRTTSSTLQTKDRSGD